MSETRLDEFAERIRMLELRAQSQDQDWPDARSLPEPLSWPETTTSGAGEGVQPAADETPTG